MVDLEDCELVEVPDAVGQGLDGVLTEVEIGQVGQALDVLGNVLQMVLGYVQASQGGKVTDFLMQEERRKKSK